MNQPSHAADSHARRFRRGGIRLLLGLGLASGSACAGAGIESGPSRTASALGWGDLVLGISLEEASARLGEDLELESIEDRCGDAGTRFVRGRTELFLSFSGNAPGARLQSIVRRLPPEASPEEIVSDLERRFPGLRYRPDPRWPNMPEEEDPNPFYVHPDLPDQGIRIGLEEGWMRVGYLRCLE